MKQSLFVRELTAEELNALKQATRSASSFTRRRAQILLLSRQRLKTAQIADGLAICSQTVRNAIHDFHTSGLASLEPKPMGPKAPEYIFDDEKSQQLMEIAHQSPRRFGKERSTWSLSLLAEVAFEQGLTEHEVSYETIRDTFCRLGIRWQRAKQWIRSPDPQYALKKSSSVA